MRKSAMLENKTNKQKKQQQQKEVFCLQNGTCYKNIVQTRPDTTFA